MKNISDILREEREKKGLSINDVVNATKIRREFLESIESADYNSLPSESYALGFVKNYALFLGVPLNRASALFRREYEAKKIEIMPHFRKTKAFSGRKLFLRSPRSYLILAVILVVLFYIVFQFSFIFVGPKLTVATPKSKQEVSGHFVSVSGKTDPYATVLVNNEEVYVDLTGSFQKTLYVYSGNKKITIVAKNRFGKETRRTIDISVK